MVEVTARNECKVRRGYVVSNKMDKTVVVQIEDRAKHALYDKAVRKNKKIKVYDGHNEYGIGDLILIMEIRPLLVAKHWHVVEILEKAERPSLIDRDPFGKARPV